MLSPGEREELKRSIAEELRDYIETEEFKLFKEAGYIAQSKLYKAASANGKPRRANTRVYLLCIINLKLSLQNLQTITSSVSRKVVGTRTASANSKICKQYSLGT